MKELQGTFKKIDLQGKTIEEWCKEQCINQGQIDRCEDETWEDLFFCIHDDEYFIINDELYQILKIEYIENYSYVKVDKQDDNTYSFHTIYHDGTTCLIECLAEGLNNMNLKMQNNE